MTTLRMTVDTADVAAALARLSKAARGRLPREAAQAGSQVLVDEVRARVAAMGRKTGNLAASIYQAYSKDNSGPFRATYHVSWNQTKAPHGHLVEFGHMQKYRVFIDSKGDWKTVKSKPLATPRRVAARPFIRPAFEAKKKAARAVMESTLVAEMAREMRA